MEEKRTHRVLSVTHVFVQGVFGETPDLRWDRHLPCQLEADRVRSHPPGIQGLGRPGGLERRLLPNSQGYHCGGHVSLLETDPKILRFSDRKVEEMQCTYNTKAFRVTDSVMLNVSIWSQWLLTYRFTVLFLNCLIFQFHFLLHNNHYCELHDKDNYSFVLWRWKRKCHFTQQLLTHSLLISVWWHNLLRTWKKLIGFR